MTGNDKTAFSRFYNNIPAPLLHFKQNIFGFWTEKTRQDLFTVKTSFCSDQRVTDKFRSNGVRTQRAVLPPAARGTHVFKPP